MNVPQIGAQFGELSFDIEAGSIPLDQCARRESMAQVMQPWTATVILGRHAQANLLRYLGEVVVRRVNRNPPPTFGDEERRSRWCRKEAISDFSVLFQSGYRSGMNRHIA